MPPPFFPQVEANSHCSELKQYACQYFSKAEHFLSHVGTVLKCLIFCSRLKFSGGRWQVWLISVLLTLTKHTWMLRAGVKGHPHLNGQNGFKTKVKERPEGWRWPRLELNHRSQGKESSHGELVSGALLTKEQLWESEDWGKDLTVKEEGLKNLIS